MRRSRGESEVLVKLLTDFSEAAEVAVGNRSEVYWDILSARGLPSMLMRGGSKAGIPQSSGKGLSDQS